MGGQWKRMKTTVRIIEEKQDMSTPKFSSRCDGIAGAISVAWIVLLRGHQNAGAQALSCVSACANLANQRASSLLNRCGADCLAL